MAVAAEGNVTGSTSIAAAIRSKNDLNEFASSINTIKGLTAFIAGSIRQSVPEKGLSLFISNHAASIRAKHHPLEQIGRRRSPSWPRATAMATMPHGLRV
jgi:hypothetical protein